METAEEVAFVINLQKKQEGMSTKDLIVVPIIKQMAQKTLGDFTF